MLPRRTAARNTECCFKNVTVAHVFVCTWVSKEDDGDDVDLNDTLLTTLAKRFDRV